MRSKFVIAAIAIACASPALAADDYSPLSRGAFTVNPAFGMWGGPFIFNADLYGSNFTVSGHFGPMPPVSFGVTPADHPGWMPKPPGDDNPPPPDNTPPPKGNPPPPSIVTFDDPPPPPGTDNPPAPPGTDNPPPSIITFDDPPGPPNNPNGNPPCDPPGDPVVTPGAPLPEPATWISMILGFAMLGAMLRAPLRRTAKA